MLKVLVIDGQDHVPPDKLLEFAEHFGVAERVEHPDWDDVPGLKRHVS